MGELAAVPLFTTMHVMTGHARVYFTHARGGVQNEIENMYCSALLSVQR